MNHALSGKCEPNWQRQVPSILMTRQLAARHERHEWRGGSGGSVKGGEREETL